MTATEPIEPAAEEVPFELPEGFADTVKGWDIPVDQLPEVVSMYKALQTEEGQIDGFLKFGQNLGFGLKELERLFVDEEPVTPAAPVAPVVPEPEEDLDRPLTAREVREMLASEREAVTTQISARDAAAQEARAQRAFKVIGDWYEKNEITEDNAKAVIGRLGEEIAQKEGRDTFNPDDAVWALEQGRAAYDAFVENEAQKLIARKAVIAAAQPTVLSGGDIGGGDGDEPHVYRGRDAFQDAKARVRQKLRESGELG